MSKSNNDFKAQQFHSDTADFNKQALQVLKDTALLATQKELTELVLIASSEDDTTAQILTDNPAMVMVKLLTMVSTTTEQLGAYLPSEELALLKAGSAQLQKALAKL